jgi:hypothetical protein
LSDAASGLFITAKNFIGQTVWDNLSKAVSDETESPIFYEQLLLQASAELELSGSIDLLMDESYAGPTTVNYALYDYDKYNQTKKMTQSDTMPASLAKTSEVGPQTYFKTYNEIHSTLAKGTQLLDEAEIKELFAKGQTEKTELGQTYVRFTVTSHSIS